MLPVEAFRLLLSIQHGYVRRHAPIRKPKQKLARPIALVRSHANGLNTKRSFQHLPGRNVQVSD